MSQRTQNRTWRDRALSLLLAVALLAGLAPGLSLPASAEHWADPYLDQLVDWGVIRADQTANPDAPLTRAEFMAIVNRAYGYTEAGPIPFTDVRTSDWFYDDVCIAYTAGYMAGTSGTTASPNETLTREQAICILGRNMMLEDTPGESLAFADSRDVSDWARGTVKTAVDSYIVSGYPDNTFQPLASVSRAQMAVLITQCIGTPVSQSGDFELGGVFGNVTITAPNVTLRNTTISGDLYVSGGVGLGGIKLENVDVLGRIIVSSSGESESGDASVIMRNVNARAMLVDNMRNKTVTVRADGVTEIANTVVRTSAYLEDNNTDDKGLLNISVEGEPGTRLTLAGRIKEVVNKTPQSTIQVAKGTVAKLTVDEAATNSTVQIDRNTEVEELNLDVATNVIGEGDIGKLNVNAPGSVVTMLPDQIYIRPGLTASIAGVIMDYTAALEGSTDPRLLSGYPAAKDIAPTGFRADFSGNKKGTIYWAVSSISDGSIGEEDLISPPSYGSRAIAGGSVAAPAGDTVVNAQVTGLTVAGSYYLSALLRDEQGRTSPVKVISFSTPDNTVPAFAQGYPYMSRTTRDVAQVTVMPTKSCKLYYALLPQGAQAPTVNELKSAAVIGNLGYGVRDVTKNTEDVFTVNNQRLEELKSYVLYLWLTDVDGANSSAVQALQFTVPDETPPVVTPDPYPTADGIKETTIDLSTGMDEAGTIFWVVVPENDPYPLPNNQSYPLSKDNIVDPETGLAISARLDSDYAKLGVANGRGGLVRGSVAVRDANTEVTINIRGLTGETTYDLYYVGRDTAGNYSEVVKKVTINTADTSGPVVYQYFSDYQGENETEHPLANADVILRFNESITVNGLNLLTLYETANSKDEGVTTADKNMATENLLKSLRENFILYKANSTNGRYFPVVEKDADGYDPESWVDYTQVVIRRTEDLKGVEVVFTNGDDKAIKMASGGSYYFQLTNIRDNADSPNRTDPPVLRWDNIENQTVKKGHVLPKFETVFAQVVLSENRTTSPAPVWIDNENPAINNDAGRELDADGTATNYARVDTSFFVSPESTQNAGENDCFDIVLFTDRSVSYDLYYRIRDTKNNNAAITDSTDAKFTQYKLPTTNSLDSNGWVYLGNKEANKRSGDNTWDTGSLDANVLSLALQDYPKLRSLGENLSYEFAISVTELDGNTTFKTWGDKFDFNVYIVAGGSRSLYNVVSIGGGYTPDSLLASDGVTSIGEPTTVKLPVTFVESEQPIFQTDPSFGEGDTFQPLTFGLDNPGTLYYVIAPKTNPLPTNLNVTKAAGSATVGELDRNTANYETMLWDVVTAQTNSANPGNLTDKATGALEYYTVINNTPHRRDIVDIAEDDSAYAQLIGGTVSYNGRNGIEITESVPGANSTKRLSPKTEYYIYIVLEAKSGNPLSRSNVYIYNFKTSDTAKPKISLSDRENGFVRIETGTYADHQVQSDLVWRVFMNKEAENQLNNLGTFKIPSADSAGNAISTTYQSMDIITALTTPYRASDAYGATIPANADYGADYDGFSVFDIYGDAYGNNLKAKLDSLIRESSTSIGSISNGDAATLIENNYTDMVDWFTGTDATYDSPSYTILVAGHNKDSIRGQNEGWSVVDSFAALTSIRNNNMGAPTLLSVSGGITQIFGTGGSKTYSGGITITFDKNVYWRENATADAYKVLQGNTLTKPSGSGTTATLGSVGILYDYSSTSALGTGSVTSASATSTTPRSNFTISFDKIPMTTITLLPTGEIISENENPGRGGIIIRIIDKVVDGSLADLHEVYVEVEFNGVIKESVKYQLQP